MTTDRPENIKVLIVEDDPIHRHVLQGSLEDNYSLEFAIDGEHALAKLKEHQYDLIIVDLRLPKQIGEPATTAESFKILQALKNSTQTKSIVICVTGHLTDELEYQIKQLGVIDRIFEKPFFRRDLRNYIDHLFKKNS